MNYNEQITEWILADNQRMGILENASLLELNDWCLAAGFVRNLVWDKLHQYKISTPFNDIDFIYFDSNNPVEDADRRYENCLSSKADYPWSVKNQARMHTRNNDAPYLSTADAMSYWPEVETAVGVRLSKKHRLEIIAPFGLEPLFSSTITINDKRRKPKDFLERVSGKKWVERWPQLRLNWSNTKLP